jgi:hypothetical protein
MQADCVLRELVAETAMSRQAGSACCIILLPTAGVQCSNWLVADKQFIVAVLCTYNIELHSRHSTVL